MPKIVAQVNSESEIAALLALAHQHRVAVTFRAAGTSLSGQAVTDSVLVTLGAAGPARKCWTAARAFACNRG